MASLGTNCLRIEIPTQTLSLLANVAGFHVLAFSDLTTKSRFCYKLRHTLFRGIYFRLTIMVLNFRILRMIKLTFIST